MNETRHSIDAMHYSPAPADADTAESLPDPVAGLAPDEAARVLAAAEQIDPVALLDAIERRGGTDGHLR